MTGSNDGDETDRPKPDPLDETTFEDAVEGTVEFIEKLFDSGEALNGTPLTDERSAELFVSGRAGSGTGRSRPVNAFELQPLNCDSEESDGSNHEN